MKNLKAFALISLLVLSTGVLFAQKKSDVKPEGTWTFTAPDAPYEYSTGDIVISREGKELKGEFVFSEHYKLKVHDLKLEDDVLTFKAYIEGEVIYAKATITKDELKGKVSYSEGIVDISAIRNKK